MKKMYLSFLFPILCFSFLQAQLLDCFDANLVNPNVVCPSVYEPVCGCDGVTYLNECEARYTGGLNAYLDGACETLHPCVDPSILQPGVFCPEVYQPVCGCDGVTYGNECYAFLSGVAYTTYGACQCSMDLNSIDVTFPEDDPNRAVIEWYGDAAYYELQYRPVFENIWNTVATSYPSGVNLYNYFHGNVTLNNLEPNKLYRFRIRSFCGLQNWTNFSPTQSFKTPKCEPPTNIIPSQLYNNKVRLDWDHNQFSDKYQVFYRVAGSSDVWEKELVGIPGRTWKILKNLIPSVTYEYKIRSYCEVDYGHFSPLATFTNSPTGNPRLNHQLSIESAIRPNPVQQELYVDLDINTPAACRVTIIDVLGKRQMVLNENVDVGMHSFLLDTSQLSPGQFILMVEYNGEIEHHKFIKVE